MRKATDPCWRNSPEGRAYQAALTAAVARRSESLAMNE